MNQKISINSKMAYKTEIKRRTFARYMTEIRQFVKHNWDYGIFAIWRC